jgi:hypothetical protein
MKKIKINKRLNKTIKNELAFFLNGRNASAYIAHECYLRIENLKTENQWEKIDYSLRYWLTYYASFYGYVSPDIPFIQETFIFEPTAYEKKRRKLEKGTK